MRVGIIDCGTNTVRLLVADVVMGDDGPALRDVVRTLRFVRLGQGVDATHRFNPEALARTFAALDEYAALIAANGPLDALRFLATSAARDAENREEFIDGVTSRLGVVPEVISGDEEARLSFLGAQSAFAPVDLRRPEPSPGGGASPNQVTLVMDIGGGSTELIRGCGGEVQVEHSFDIGSVRLRERLLVGDPPTAAQIDDARALVLAKLADGPVPLDGVGAFIGVAGTCTSLSAMNMALTSYDPMCVDRSVLQPDEISGLAQRLLAMTVADVQAQYPILEPMRAEVICAGALICDLVASQVGLPMLVRETDILDGAAIGVAKALVAQR